MEEPALIVLSAFQVNARMDFVKEGLLLNHVLTTLTVMQSYTVTGQESSHSSLPARDREHLTSRARTQINARTIFTVGSQQQETLPRNACQCTPSSSTLTLDGTLKTTTIQHSRTTDSTASTVKVVWRSTTRTKMLVSALTLLRLCRGIRTLLLHTSATLLTMKFHAGFTIQMTSPLMSLANVRLTERK